MFYSLSSHGMVKLGTSVLTVAFFVNTCQQALGFDGGAMSKSEREYYAEEVKPQVDSINKAFDAGWEEHWEKYNDEADQYEAEVLTQEMGEFISKYESLKEELWDLELDWDSASDVFALDSYRTYMLSAVDIRLDAARDARYAALAGDEEVWDEVRHMLSEADRIAEEGKEKLREYEEEAMDEK